MNEVNNISKNKFGVENKIKIYTSKKKVTNKTKKIISYLEIF